MMTIDMTAALAPMFYMMIAMLFVSAFGIYRARSVDVEHSANETSGTETAHEVHEERHDGSMSEAA